MTLTTSNIQQAAASSPAPGRSRTSEANVSTLSRQGSEIGMGSPALPGEPQNTSLTFGSKNSHPHRTASYSTFPKCGRASSPRQNQRKREIGRRRERSSLRTARVKVPQTLSTPKSPLARRLGQRASPRRGRAGAGPGPGRLGILTGLSPLCSPSSRSLWQAWRRPHPAVVRSSGPRPQGTFSPPRLRPASGSSSRGCRPRGRRPSAPPPPPRARRPARIQAGPGLPAANLDTSERPRLVRASGEEPRGREGAGRGEGRPPSPPQGRRERKRKPVELVFLGEEANWPSR